eukprot:9479760-Pyramimonas_sp.AAC.1
MRVHLPHSTLLDTAVEGPPHDAPAIGDVAPNAHVCPRLGLWGGLGTHCWKRLDLKRSPSERASERASERVSEGLTRASPGAYY